MFKQLKNIDRAAVNEWKELTQSYAFYKYSDTTESPAKLTRALHDDHIKKNLQQAFDFYPDLQNFLLELIDHQHGITTRRQYTEHFPTGVGIVRVKHTNKERIAPQHNFFYLLNMLLRAISMVRTIDYALSEIIKNQPEQAQHHTNQRVKLKNLFSILLGNSISIQTTLNETDGEEDVDSLTRCFHSKLFETLQGTGLDYGVREGESKDCSKRLDYFRYLSGLLDPAPSCVTIFDLKSLHTVTISHPICVKTDDQIDAIQAWNFHEPLLLLNDIFKPLLLKNDRCCSAQLRKHIPFTNKNAFIVNLLIFHHKKLIANEWVMRSGSISYVGPCNDPTVQALSAKQNLEQLRAYSIRFTGNGKIHASILVTKSSLNRQKIIVNTAQEVIRKSGDHTSYTPVNFQGCCHALSLDPEIIQTSEAAPYRIPTPCARAHRALSAATIIEIAQQYPGITALLFCASGQDRTGVIITLFLINTILKYGLLHQMDLTFDEVAQAYALARDTQVMASLLCLGAEGLKSVSNPGSLFNELTYAYLFLRSAHRNKGSLVHSEQSIKISRQSLLLNCKQEIIRRFSEFVTKRSKRLNGLSVFHSYELSATKLNLVKQFLFAINRMSLEDIFGALQALESSNTHAVNSKKASSCLFSRIGNGSLHTITSEAKDLLLNHPTLS